jgi:hypothetical protein
MRTRCRLPTTGALGPWPTFCAAAAPAQSGSGTSLPMKTVLRRLERLKTVQDLQESNRHLQIEFAYLKQSGYYLIVASRCFRYTSRLLGNDNRTTNRL